MRKLNAGQPIVFDDGTMQPPFRDYLLSFEGGLSVSWSQVYGTPTTAGGYGITDVYTKSETNARRPNPNLVINGSFIINQRGGTRSPGNGNYGFDRWKGFFGALLQVVEYTGQASDMTLSWKGGGTGAVGGASGSSPVTGSVSSGNFSVIVPSNATEVKCEQGSEATPFLDPLYADELSRCQRYFYRYSYDSRFACRNYSAARINKLEGFALDFPVTMRATPTASLTGSITYDGCSYLDVVADSEGVTVRVDKDATDGAYRMYGQTLEMDAEI